MRRILSIACLLALMTFSCTQNNQTDSPDLTDPAPNEIQNKFLNNQAEALLSQANEVFSNYPPSWPEPAARRCALLLLDGVFHDVYAPQRPPVQHFLKTSINRAVNEIEQTQIINGARI